MDNRNKCHEIYQTGNFNLYAYYSIFLLIHINDANVQFPDDEKYFHSDRLLYYHHNNQHEDNHIAVTTLQDSI